MYLPEADTKFPVCCGKRRAALQNWFQVSAERVSVACQRKAWEGSQEQEESRCYYQRAAVESYGCQGKATGFGGF